MNITHITSGQPYGVWISLTSQAITTMGYEHPPYYNLSTIWGMTILPITSYHHYGVWTSPTSQVINPMGYDHPPYHKLSTLWGTIIFLIASYQPYGVWHSSLSQIINPMGYDHPLHHKLSTLWPTSLSQAINPMGFDHPVQCWRYLCLAIITFADIIIDYFNGFWQIPSWSRISCYWPFCVEQLCPCHKVLALLLCRTKLIATKVWWWLHLFMLQWHTKMHVWRHLTSAQTS